MLETAFNLWGTGVTWLEIVAFVLTLACIALNVGEVHWGWPLAIVSSLLYAWLFYASGLYGEAGLQVFFALAAVWGWAQWLFGKRQHLGQLQVLHVARLEYRHSAVAIGSWLLMFVLLGAFLDRATDSDVPWLDAFPTAGSVLGQVLLARKYIDNWLVWIVVNAASIALFVYKGLYLTAMLYAILLLMAVWGWRVWQTKLRHT
jgi:nicotinamide mononucleotide transporter